jgi:predicted Zn-dependent protease with MMP-like domain
LKLTEFERHARRAFEEIPEAYREGIDGLVVSKEAPEHPTLPGIYTLGHCLTESHLSDYGGPETTRSVIALYHGSFHALAQENPDFDWEEEIWETLTHELRHHLESLAGDDSLEGVDYAADQTFNREEGLAFDPWYWQHGDDLQGGVYRVERDFYVEQVWTGQAFDAADALELTWRGTRWRVPKPERLGDVHFVFLGQLDENVQEVVELVLVRKRSWWRDLARLTGTSRAEVLETEAVAEAVES